ncbi:P-loop containing nucleoside triphosphate hydrolase protein [Nadsonia fulvescens var. elongata DSM 6958]|uniref:p-loop containing nucleoside triphosphate hydrolase protein n=1 Tax=Nadsonia fulvescens var. elongata DSM 6958 TaxID=857566 RepID=A0A1E3PHC6_9ASCO|nr:P-loop containing nucleoside triphosphate hydrolase protein [Nadsonia fulvescens var. elongata DSM 6958]
MPKRPVLNDTYLAEQELSSMYDYLAKIILLGPSGCGKSCILHRYVHDEWRIMASQTIGVEFSSKIVKIGQNDSNPKSARNDIGYSPVTRMKLQLWDTAGQERFRSLTRGYYRGAAGVLLVYDITNHQTFKDLQYFIQDIRSLTSPSVSILVVCNKIDLVPTADPTTLVNEADLTDFCNVNDVEFIKLSALTNKNVTEAFEKLSSMILTKVELGFLDPEDPETGVQYGDVPRWDATVRLKGTRNSLSTNINLLGLGYSSSGSRHSGPACYTRSATEPDYTSKCC